MPLSFTTGTIASSGSTSTVFRFTVSPQIPPGNSRRLAHTAKLQLDISHSSSVHLHQALSPRYIVAFFPHRNNLQLWKHFFASVKACTIHFETKVFLKEMHSLVLCYGLNKVFYKLFYSSDSDFFFKNLRNNLLYVRAKLNTTTSKTIETYVINWMVSTGYPPITA